MTETVTTNSNSAERRDAQDVVGECWGRGGCRRYQRRPGAASMSQAHDAVEEIWEEHDTAIHTRGRDFEVFPRARTRAASARGDDGPHCCLD